MSRSQRKDRPRRGKPNLADQARKAVSEGEGRKSFYASYFTPAAIRETLESVIIALVAAFLLRAFVVEAFVIPTGSMAPTLMGRHKDVTCAKCGYSYRVNASPEMDEQERPTGLGVISGTCPMCRFTMDLSTENTLKKSFPSYSGDRILAGRANYELGNPRRWDVVVFEFPLNASVNYIKRLAGLPDETLRIQYGDVWIKPEGAAEFALCRKPPGKILAMMQPVYDNDYVLPEMVRKGWPMRWTSAEGGWKASDDLKSFSINGTAAGEAWLEYEHAVPGYEDWAFRVGLLPVPPQPPRAQLVSDFTAYDTNVNWRVGSPGGGFGQPLPRAFPEGFGQQPNAPALGLNWVGDLVVEFEADVKGESGQLAVELVKGGHPFLCELDLKQGTAELTIPGRQGARPKSTTGIRGPGKHTVRLANVDQQLLLWIDGRLATFDGPTTYEMEEVNTTVPNREDLRPVRIGSQGAGMEVRHLKVLRDIYYIAVKARTEDAPPRVMCDFDPSAPDYPYTTLSQDRVARFFSSEAQWGVFGERRSVQFELGKDEFFMLGDNSAESKDSRLWGESQHYVSRDLLIGQGLVVYWPHSWHRIPGTPIPFPFFPNFSRMGRIR